MTDAGGHRGSYVDPIDRLRAHVERHKHRTGLYVSTEGVKALLDRLDNAEYELKRWKEATAERPEWEKLWAEQAERAEALEEQVKRLIAKDGERISAALRAAHHQGSTQK